MFDNLPTRLHIELTTACNAACPACARYLDDDPILGIVENPNVPQNSLTLEKVKEILEIEWIKKLKSIKISGVHGEPTLAKECIDIIKWFREINPDVSLELDSNGSTRTKKWWRELAQFFQSDHIGNNLMTFWIDGLEDTNHIYRRRTVWSKIMENAQAFIDAGGLARWQMIVWEHNEHQILTARKMAKSMGFNRFGVRISERHLSRPITWLKTPKYYKKPLIDTTVHCQAQIMDELFVSANGLLTPCCFIDELIYGPHMQSSQQETLETMGDLLQYHGSNGMSNVIKLFNRVSDRFQTNPLEVCKTMCTKTYGNHHMDQDKIVEIFPNESASKGKLVPKFSDY